MAELQASAQNGMLLKGGEGVRCWGQGLAAASSAFDRSGVGAPRCRRRRGHWERHLMIFRTSDLHPSSHDDDTQVEWAQSHVEQVPENENNPQNLHLLPSFQYVFMCEVP